MGESLRDASRRAFVTTDHTATHQEIRTGCLQRIADATEVAAKNNNALIEDRDMYKRWYEEGQAAVRRLERRNRALRGVITRLKRQAEYKPAQRGGIDD